MAVLALAAFALVSCSGGGGGGGAGLSQGDIDLVSVSFGRLVDVYGYEGLTDKTLVLFQRDVVIGTDIEDENPSAELPDVDGGVVYDFRTADPTNLQPRLLIVQPVGSPEFDAAFGRLSLRVKRVAAGLFGQDTSTEPFSVVARNAAIQLTFSSALPIDDSFFFEPSPTDPGVLDLKNTMAAQLLVIRGDPNDGNSNGDFEQIPARVSVRDNLMILDPVLLGREGSSLLLPNNASGLPASSNQDGANIRIALSLTGPLRIPGLRERFPAFIGRNNAGNPSIVRDFRSGNENDNSTELSRGFIRDSEPPRLVGAMLMAATEVLPPEQGEQLVKISKSGVEHDIDAGDAFLFYDGVTGIEIGQGEVLEDPPGPGEGGDEGCPAVQDLWVRIAEVPGLFEANSPNAVLSAEFASWRVHPDQSLFPDPPEEPADFPDDVVEDLEAKGLSVDLIDLVNGIYYYRDNPANFVSFAPEPLPEGGLRSPPNQNISPFAEGIIRFNKPVDLSTVRAFDSLLFAMRNVFDDDVIRDEFVTPSQIDPARFDKDKYATPHIIAARVVDEDGSQTGIRLQPVKGFYLDDEMRDVDPPSRPFDERDFRYFMHILSGADGVRDLSGNPVDFVSEVGQQDFLVFPFSLDTRRPNGSPLFPDNLAVSVVRRYASEDEDEQPSLYRQTEQPRLTAAGVPVPDNVLNFPLADVFGSVSYVGGKLLARPTTRIRKVVDDLNQLPPPPPTEETRFCPFPGTVAATSAGVRFNSAGIQNPLNPFGSRLQTVWREIDLSLSRIDPNDFNLDVEQLYWAPFQSGAITFDQFDRTSLFLGHSEERPEPCIGFESATPTMGSSGLRQRFADNYAFNFGLDGRKGFNPLPHPAYTDTVLTIDASQTLTEVNNVNRFLPLPEFQKPYFVWRDETVPVQGGEAGGGAGSDVSLGGGIAPYIIAPWLTGNGRYIKQEANGSFVPDLGRLNNAENLILVTNPGSSGDARTGGGVPSIGLPLLADFWTYCDDPSLPEGNGFRATGFNGWQISLSVQSSPQPNFRVYSGGFSGGGSSDAICIDESSTPWSVAGGGYDLQGQPTGNFGDNSVYWVMADFVKRQTVVTSGFIDVFNPHRMPIKNATPYDDPRLGSYLSDDFNTPQRPEGIVARFDWLFEPPLESLPTGTSVVPEFRGSSAVSQDPWRFNYCGRALLGWDTPPSTANFPLDPFKACDAGIRKWDERNRRRGWAYYYTRQVSNYTTSVADLSSTEFLNSETSNRESFGVNQLRYVNWRFIMRNNVDANPAISPEIESFALTYRFER